MARGARRLVAGPALQVQQQRPVEALGICDLAREDGDPLAVGVGVVERDGELVLDETQSWWRDGDGHRRGFSTITAVA